MRALSFPSPEGAHGQPAPDTGSFAAALELAAAQRPDVSPELQRILASLEVIVNTDDTTEVARLTSEILDSITHEKAVGVLFELRELASRLRGLKDGVWTVAEVVYDLGGPLDAVQQRTLEEAFRIIGKALEGERVIKARMVEAAREVVDKVQLLEKRRIELDQQAEDLRKDREFLYKEAARVSKKRQRVNQDRERYDLDRAQLSEMQERAGGVLAIAEQLETRLVEVAAREREMEGKLKADQAPKQENSPHIQRAPILRRLITHVVTAAAAILLWHYSPSFAPQKPTGETTPKKPAASDCLIDGVPLVNAVAPDDEDKGVERYAVVDVGELIRRTEIKYGVKFLYPRPTQDGGVEYVFGKGGGKDVKEVMAVNPQDMTQQRRASDTQEGDSTGVSCSFAG